MSDNPAFPDAPATAPGGMSEKALIAELIERHGYDERSAKQMTWPQKIDAVAESRRERELEKGSATVASEAVSDTSDTDIEEFFAEVEKGQAEVRAESLFIGMPHTRDFIFDNHFGAGPSGAERWMNCTEALGMARKFLETLSPNQQKVFAKGGTAARQGTTAHAAAETEAMLVLGRIDEAERDGALLELTVMPDVEDEAYDEEMGEYISEYVDLVRTYATERGDDRVLIEQRVEAAIPLTEELSDGNDIHVISGSGDCIVLPTKAEPDLVVADLKYGAGIDVDVDQNPQVRIYALGALDLLTDDEGNLVTDVRTVTYVIAQPRLGGIKTWTETLDDLLDWRDEVLSPALTAALTGKGAKFDPGELTCQWCPARGTCPALTKQRVEQAADLFDVIVEAEFEDGPGAFPETALLDSARLGSLLGQIQGLIKIHDDLREEAQRRLHRGEEVPGYKMVGYTPPRKWEEKAAEALDPDITDTTLSTEQVEALWQRKMVTPKQAITLLKKQYGVDNAEEVLAELITHPVQRPVIARVDDRRHEWKGAPPEQMFADETDTVLDEDGVRA